MRISVVIPTYNRQALLSHCLTAATNQDYADYEVVVVDDASSDGTAGMVRERFPHVHYLRQVTNRGPATARNRGVREATGDTIAFTDDDCVPPSDWLSRLADGYRRHPSVGAVGGYQEASAEVLRTSLVAQYERHVNRQVYHVRDQEYWGGFECPAGGTNNLSYPRRVLQEVGGFDETFPVAAGEDAYLKWQIVQRGYRFLFVPIKVTHLQEYSLSAFRRQQVRRGMGAAHFEWRLYGHYPRPGRIFLRWVKRSLAFLPDLVRMGPALAFVQMFGGWADAWGQYQAWQSYRPRFEGQERRR